MSNGTAVRRRRISSIMGAAAGVYHPNANGGSIGVLRYNMNNAAGGTTFGSDEDALIYGWHIGKDLLASNPVAEIQDLLGNVIFEVDGAGNLVTGDVSLQFPLFIEGGFRINMTAAGLFSIVWSKTVDGAMV